MKQRRGVEGGTATGDARADAAVPGKRTLTEGLAPTGGGASLPGPVQAKMEGAFGFDFSSVRVHEGEHASALGAAAYTEGTDLHFAPGQYAPDSASGQALIGHELAHVVQQSEGRVAATTQFKGVELNDDHGLESEADLWGERAARGESVGRASGGAPSGGGQVQRKVVQRSPQASHAGRFLDTAYGETARGVDITLEFEPGAEVDATKIGLTQSVKVVASGSPVTMDPQTAPRQVPSGGPGAGFEIDRVAGRNDPIYGSTNVGAGQSLSATATSNAPSGATPEVVDPSTRNATYRLGFHFSDASGPHAQNAQMHDAPARRPSPNTGMEFETTALAIEGAQQGTYYGSVKWGYNIDASGTLTKIPFTIASMGVPTQNFLAAAGQWNTATAGGTLKARNAPTQLFSRSGTTFTASFTIDRGTTVVSNGTFGDGAISYVSVTIRDGAHANQTAWVPATDLADQGDGPATVDLPVPTVETLASPQTLNDGVPGPWRDVQTLAAGTRVERTGDHWGNPPAGKVHVRVVDGPNTGARGYVDGAALNRERP